MSIWYPVISQSESNTWENIETCSVMLSHTTKYLMMVILNNVNYLRVEIHFAEALTATINVIMYAEFDNVIEIDRNRQVLFDYSA